MQKTIYRGFAASVFLSPIPGRDSSWRLIVCTKLREDDVYLSCDGGTEMNSRLVCTSARTVWMHCPERFARSVRGRWITSGRDGAVCSRSRRSESRKLVYGPTRRQLTTLYVHLIEGSRALELFVSRWWLGERGWRTARAGKRDERGEETAKIDCIESRVQSERKNPAPESLPSNLFKEFRLHCETEDFANHETYE